MATRPLPHVTKRSNSSDSMENTANKKFASATQPAALIKNEYVSPKPEQKLIVPNDANEAHQPRSSKDLNNNYPTVFAIKSFLFIEEATRIRRDYCFVHETVENIRQMVAFVWAATTRSLNGIKDGPIPRHCNWTINFLMDRRFNIINYSASNPLIQTDEAGEPSPQFINDFREYVHNKILAVKSRTPPPPSPSELIRTHELKFIREVFPNMSPEGVYMALDMFNTHSSKQGGREDEIVDFIISHKLNSDHAIESDEDEDNKAIELAEFNLDEDFAKITGIIGDCDPAHIFKELNLMRSDPNRVEKLLADLIEKRNYPRLRDQVVKKNQLNRVESLLNMKLDKEEFVQMYPEPREYFYKTDAVMSESYRAHCISELMNAFGFITEDSILTVMAQNKFHYAPSFRQLEEAFTFQEESLKARIKTNVAPLHASYSASRAGTPWSVTDPDFVKLLTKYKKGRFIVRKIFCSTRFNCCFAVKFMKKGRNYKLENVCRPKVEYPTEPDEYFYRERLYVKHQNEIDG